MPRTAPLPTVHILYENPLWLPPLQDALTREGFRHELHFVDDTTLDPSAVPPDGIWWNRISPSSHTRDHVRTVALTRELLYWLESHGRRVINGSRAFELEVSKARQDQVLRRHGIRTPRTVLVAGTKQIVDVARTFHGAFITKHNQGGKGLGIELFGSAEQLADWIADGHFDAGPNQQVILQQYIQSTLPRITRVEIAGGRFLFAQHSATSQGFQLCPADACQKPASSPDVCPVDAAPTPTGSDRFTQADLRADDPLVQAYLRLARAEGIDVAGIEYVEDEEGLVYTYDINGTTNYNGKLAELTGVHGMLEVARWIRRELAPAQTLLRAS